MLCDDDGNVFIPDNTLRLSDRSVTADVTVWPVKEFSVDWEKAIIGKQLEGYVVEGITFTGPERLKTAGNPDVLSKMEAIQIAPVNIDKADATVTSEIRPLLPEGIILVDDSPVYLNIHIKPEISTRVFENVAVRLQTETSQRVIPGVSVEIEVKGPKVMLDKLTAASLSAWVDARNVISGVHELPVSLKYNGESAEVILKASPEKIAVTVP